MPVVAAFAVPHPPLIVPGVGHGRERDIAATVAAYEEVARRVAELAPDTLVISSPHATSYLDYLHISPGRGARGDFRDFGDRADGSDVSYDVELVRELGDAAEAAGIPAGTRGERDARLDWGVLVPLHFIQARCQGFKVVRMGLAGFSPLEHYRLGRLVQEAAARLDRRVVYVASGDLSHKLAADGPYGYAPDGPVFDEAVCEAFASGDFLRLLTMDAGLCERAAECGLRSFQIMAGALDGTPVRAELFSHEGPFGVGYGVAAFTPCGPEGSDPARRFEAAYRELHERQLAETRSREDAYVQLARASLESYVRDGRQQELPADLPPELAQRRAGAFVSLTKDARLRGYACTDADLSAFVARFPFAFTAGQTAALRAIAGDLRSPHRMNRLLQGDVGSGKTAVALCAAFMAVRSGRQAALLAPTEVLAAQTFALVQKYLPEANALFLAGSTPAAEKRKSKRALAAGESLLVCGTHAVLEADVAF